jgi:hypothetical protein
MTEHLPEMVLGLCLQHHLQIPISAIIPVPPQLSTAEASGLRKLSGPFFRHPGSRDGSVRRSAGARAVTGARETVHIRRNAGNRKAGRPSLAFF